MSIFCLTKTHVQMIFSRKNVNQKTWAIFKKQIIKLILIKSKLVLIKSEHSSVVIKSKLGQLITSKMSWYFVSRGIFNKQKT